ncbi:hypothetical protein ACKLNR_014052 [Fusarium oxysporum f. sp. zingiberi]
MASGGIWKSKDYHYRQDLFNFMTEQSGCRQAEDKLACLRTADYGLLYNASHQLPSLVSYRATQVPWYPRPDGSFLKASPHRLLRSGNVARAPFIIGDIKDEGTIFSIIAGLNLTTDAEFRSYFKTYFFNNLSDEQVKEFTDLWPQDPAQGSPFDTGDAYVLGPQYKRLSAAIGDYTFQSGRRDLLQHTYQRQKAYTYLLDQQSFDRYERLPRFGNLSGLEPLGSFHTSEVDLNTFGDISPSISNNSLNMMSTFIAFVNSLDPNNHGLADIPNWPTWEPEKKSLLLYAESRCEIIKDDFREKEINFINNHTNNFTK